MHSRPKEQREAIRNLVHLVLTRDMGTFTPDRFKDWIKETDARFRKVGLTLLFEIRMRVVHFTIKEIRTSRVAFKFTASSHVPFEDRDVTMTVEDFATVGFQSPVHQFCRVGRYAYIGASTVITQDVPPFSRVVTERETKSYGVNTIGLERKGFSAERLKILQSAFRMLLRSKMNTTQALAEMRKKFADSEDVSELIRFIETAERGIVK